MPEDQKPEFDQNELQEDVDTVVEEFDDAQIDESDVTSGEILPVLPLRGTVVLPLTMVPLAAGQPRSLRLIDSVASGDRRVVLVMQHDEEQTDAGPDDVRTIGTLATIHQLMRIPDGTVRLA
ncbi:MAG: LON peptidase substrate-binding domain-containing protein, partial [Thermomicrobiales bacterium]